MKLPLDICYFILLLLLASCNEQTGQVQEGGEVITIINKEPVSKDTVLPNRDSLKEQIIPVTDNLKNNDTLPVLPSVAINVKDVNVENLVSFAETLKGTPYVYASTNPKVGFDCSGFITYVFSNFGISVPRSSIGFTDVGKPIPIETAKRGDIILFTGTNPEERFVGHMGLIVSNTDSLRFIHSSSGKAMGVTVTPLNAYYQGRFIKVIRIFPQNDL